VPTPIPIVLETGVKRTFATALGWPGWSRSGRDDASAIEALDAYGPRYHAVVAGIRGAGRLRSARSFEVVERLAGDAGTDFGVPAAAASADAEPVGDRELDRLASILWACWHAFDSTAAASDDVELARGPRGGGRDLAKIRAHVDEAEAAYLRALGGRTPSGGDRGAVRDAFIAALGARARGELPDTGPRGGARWTARYAVRRSAWHALDHAWEIEDRGGRASR
jgi:hypothetical protein